MTGEIPPKNGDANTRTVLGSESVELQPADNGGAVFELPDELADILEIEPGTTVEVVIEKPSTTATTVEMGLSFPNIDVTSEQRAQLRDYFS